MPIGTRHITPHPIDWDAFAFKKINAVGYFAQAAHLPSQLVDGDIAGQLPATRIGNITVSKYKGVMVGSMTREVEVGIANFFKLILVGTACRNVHRVRKAKP